LSSAASSPAEHGHPAPGGSGDAGLHDPLAESFPATPEGRVLFWIAIAFSCFQVVTALGLVSLASQIVRAVHLGFLLILVFPLIAAVRGQAPALRIACWLVGILGAAAALYQWAFYRDLILRSGYPTVPDLIVGVVLIAIVLLAAWRVMGVALPIISALFLAYCFFGQYLPSPLQTRGYAFEQVIDHMAYGTEGIYGTPIYVSSTYIFLFILFGSFLERAGMIRLFTDVSLGLVGHARGGAAKVAVISSALMGTISGSGVANVVTTGQFTIPLMKRFGYNAAFAGGVEATASMGGQIMPPVMGAVAFIMAETLGISYSEVVKAAIVPALLYFGSTFWMVHLEAGRRGLFGLPADQIPSAWAALRQRWYLILPLAALVYLLFSGYTPLFAGSIGLVLTVMLILGTALALGLPAGAVRIVFWIGLGLVAAYLVRYGVSYLIGAALLLVLANLVSKGGRETLLLCRDALAEGAKTALPVGIACATVGIIIGTMTLTGLATTFGHFIVSIGGSSLFLSLFLTMITCLILGMGIPTIPNYIITSSLAGPALLKLGVPLIVSHMFVFYFGILADLTPPVALAAFAAAPIARESGMKIGLQAVRIALAGFVVPFMAVYTPALMLQDGGELAVEIGYVGAVAYVVVKACLAVYLWGAAAVGFLNRPMPIWERGVATIAAFLLVAAIPLTDTAGFVLAVLFIAQHYFRARSARPSGAA
jgi:TRAP transporter 4TM/12TM fusion protein